MLLVGISSVAVTEGFVHVAWQWEEVNVGNTGNYYWLCSVHAAAAVLLSVRLPKCSTKQQSFLNIVKSYSAFGLRMGVLQAREPLQTAHLFSISPFPFPKDCCPTAPTEGQGENVVVLP